MQLLEVEQLLPLLWREEPVGRCLLPHAGNLTLHRFAVTLHGSRLVHFVQQRIRTLPVILDLLLPLGVRLLDLFDLLVVLAVGCGDALLQLLLVDESSGELEFQRVGSSCELRERTVASLAEVLGLDRRLVDLVSDLFDGLFRVLLDLDFKF